MTEIETLPPETEEHSRARKFVIPVLVILVAIIIVAFIASQSGLDKALLRQRIDALAKSINENGRKEGRDITLTYKDIDITGGFTNRHAVVIEPQLSVKPLATATRPVTPKDELILRTERVAIYPKAADLSAVKISLDKPLDIYGGDDTAKKLLTVQSATPLDVNVATIAHDNRNYLTVSHALPEHIVFTYLREQQAEGAEDATPTVVPVYETLNVGIAPGGSVTTELSQDGSDLGEARVDLKNITITPQVAPEGAITIAQVMSDWKNTLNEKNHHVITVSINMGDVTAPVEVIPYAPISLAVEASYEGAAPQTTADVAAITAQESSFKLSKFALNAKDTSLNANADFVASGGDVLPVGTAKITLTNIQFILGELRRYGLLNEGNEPMVSQVLQLITGIPTAEITEADIDVSRTRGGSFTIGHTTFEELFATVLKESMKRHISGATDAPQDAAPTGNPAPAEDKPAAPAEPSKKIQVEEGARG